MCVKGRERFFNPNTNVTRRIHKRPFVKGEHFHAIEKGQGIPKGGHQVIYAECKIVSAEWEPLGDIIKRPYRGITWEGAVSSNRSEVDREGFPDLTPEQFCAMVIKAHSGKHLTLESPVLRYEYVHVREEDLQSDAFHLTQNKLE